MGVGDIKAVKMRLSKVAGGLYVVNMLILVCLYVDGKNITI